VSDKTWKKSERRIATLLSGRRIPVTGERDGADVETPVFCVQVKRRRSFPLWLDVWMSGICHTARRRNKTGILVLVHPGKHATNSVVCLRMSDFVDLCGPLEVRDEAGPSDGS